MPLCFPFPISKRADHTQAVDLFYLFLTVTLSFFWEQYLLILEEVNFLTLHLAPRALDWSWPLSSGQSLAPSLGMWPGLVHSEASPEIFILEFGRNAFLSSREGMETAAWSRSTWSQQHRETERREIPTDIQVPVPVLPRLAATLAFLGLAVSDMAILLPTLVPAVFLILKIKRILIDTPYLSRDYLKITISQMNRAT